ncbi:MAG: 5-(carboxyamino)imidazole ribonucleotide mutase [Acidobacteriota bacterium]|nr:MAG: 5-(carboxyamino)imidazole ribonucleotide mutase [Acidobacteriota bacterium]
MRDSPQVAVLMGSASDLETMAQAVRQLERHEVSYEVEVTSAHRTPNRTVAYVREAESRGVEVFIVGAGMAAHLGGVVAAHTNRPVLGVPLPGPLLDGLDALLATVQMPKGVPVATLGVGSHGAGNAGLLACQILALRDPALRQRLDAGREEMARQVEASADDARRRLREILDRT